MAGGAAAAAVAAAPAPGDAQAVWATWISTSITSTSLALQTASTAVTTWESWNTTITGTGYGRVWLSWNMIAEETAQERQAREQRAAQAAEQAAERARVAAAERGAAQERALELLSYCLSPAQLASYREKGWFEVRGSRGRRWRIRNRGQSGNVDLMPEIGEERDASYCAHPPGGLPDADAHLAQMLALVTDEDAFERVANLQYRRLAA